MQAITALTQLNERLIEDLTGILADLNNDQLLYCAPLIDTRSIKEVAIHVYRPILAVAHVATQQEWPPRLPMPDSSAELIEQLQLMHIKISILLNSLDETHLRTTISLPWSQHTTAFSALIEGFTHGFLHIGALQGIRAYGGFPTPTEGSNIPYST